MYKTLSILETICYNVNAFCAVQYAPTVLAFRKIILMKALWANYFGGGFVLENQFAEKVAKLWKKFGTHSIMVFATGSENRISSRPISIITYDKQFYCQTDERYLKYKQVTENPNVALSCKNLSIEGKCHVIGHPLEKGNSFFAERFKKHFPHSYKSYSALPTEKLLEITPTLIYSWAYRLLTPYMEYFDLEEQTYRIEKMD